jgi:hypothetical protein
MLTATHQHALLKTKGQKTCQMERKYYSKYPLKFDTCTWLNILKVRILNLSTLSIVRMSNSSTLSEVRKSIMSTYLE